MIITIEALKNSYLQLLKEHPHSMWAKRLDKVAHIVDKENRRTLCGSSAALLGNNYAPHLEEKKICEKCLHIAHLNQLKTTHPTQSN